MIFYFVLCEPTHPKGPTTLVTGRALACHAGRVGSTAQVVTATSTTIHISTLPAAAVYAIAGAVLVIAVVIAALLGRRSGRRALSQRLTALLGKTPRLTDPDLAVAKGAALRAHHLAQTPQLTALRARTGAGSMAGGSGGAQRTGQVVPVTPRAVGILIEDSFDPSGKRSFVEHLVTANTPLPVERTEERFGTILENQESVRVQVYEQAGPAASAEVGHNRRVLDGELTGLGSLQAGSLIRITMRIAVDGRLTVIAHEPQSGRELRLEAYVEGVVDGAETERLTKLVGLAKVRG